MEASLKSHVARYAVIATLFLTALIIASLVWNVRNFDNQAIYLATEEARANWNKDQAFRAWATRHGGLYVKPDKRTPPNIYLEHLPHRDVVTTDGVKLTLMNPAYMMSQMTREFEAIYGVKGKITGQVLLNPANEADPWELYALKEFDKGVKEITEQADIYGQPFVRLMRPMVMKKGCVLCHGHLGFKEGDIRGGVSVSVPLAPYLDAAGDSREMAYLTHGIVWIVGVMTIALFAVGGLKRERERDRLDNLKSEFISTVSHELRTPITSIKGSLGLLHSGVVSDLSDKAQSMLDVAYRNSDRLVLLINDILDVEKLESGKVEFDMKPVKISELLKEAMAVNKGYGDEHGITFICHDCAEDILVLGDKDRLMQVLANLMSNAAKFSSDGGQVELSAENCDGTIRIAVKDGGIGISDEFYKDIFEKFTQADASDTRQKGGTGLGLHISKAIVEHHGGTIDFETEVGVGSKFFFTLAAM